MLLYARLQFRILSTPTSYNNYDALSLQLPTSLLLPLPMAPRVTRQPIVDHPRPFKVTFLYHLLTSDLISSPSQRGHKVEIGAECRKATFLRYDYKFIRGFKKIGRRREHIVSLHFFSYAVLPFW